jgi:GntR family transcriptional regulator
MFESFPGGLAEPLDRSGEVPLAAQIAWRLRMLVGASVLKPGDRLPSARELARAVGVNVNTVFAVYGRLEAEGLVETQHGRGSFVLAQPPNAAGIAGLVRQTAAAARAAGLDPREIAMSLFANEASLADRTPAGGADTRGDAAERRQLRDEINRLELELTRLQPFAHAEDPLPIVSARSGPRLLSADELRTVRDQLKARVDALRVEAERRNAEAQARRRSRATTTLDARQAQPDRARAQPDRAATRSPIIVRWTPHWGTT